MIYATTVFAPRSHAAKKFRIDVILFVAFFRYWKSGAPETVLQATGARAHRVLGDASMRTRDKVDGGAHERRAVNAQPGRSTRTVRSGDELLAEDAFFEIVLGIEQ